MHMGLRDASIWRWDTNFNSYPWFHVPQFGHNNFTVLVKVDVSFFSVKVWEKKTCVRNLVPTATSPFCEFRAIILLLIHTVSIYSDLDSCSEIEVLGYKFDPFGSFVKGEVTMWTGGWSVEICTWYYRSTRRRGVKGRWVLGGLV